MGDYSHFMHKEIHELLKQTNDGLKDINKFLKGTNQLCKEIYIILDKLKETLEGYNGILTECTNAKNPIEFLSKSTWFLREPPEIYKESSKPLRQASDQLREFNELLKGMASPNLTEDSKGIMLQH